jgi:hypothetical protein
MLPLNLTESLLGAIEERLHIAFECAVLAILHYSDITHHGVPAEQHGWYYMHHQACGTCAAKIHTCQTKRVSHSAEDEHGLQKLGDLLACGAYVTAIMSSLVLKIVGPVRFLATAAFHPDMPLAYKVWLSFLAEKTTKEVLARGATKYVVAMFTHLHMHFCCYQLPASMHLHVHVCRFWPGQRMLHLKLPPTGRWHGDLSTGGLSRRPLTPLGTRLRRA